MYGSVEPDLTKACGTAACATVVASAILKNSVENNVNDVEFKEGKL